MTNTVDLQEIILGVMISKPDAALDLAARHLHPAMFENLRYRKIYGTILDMEKRGVPIDLVSVTRELQDDDTKASDISALTSHDYQVGNAEYYMTLLAEEYRQNQGRRRSLVLAEQLQGANGDAADILNAGLRDLQDIADSQAAIATEQDISEIATALLKNVDWVAEHPGELPGLTTGFVKLDKSTQGFQPANAVTVGAFTSVGKSAFLSQCAVRQAHSGIPVALFTLEMPATDVLWRMTAQFHRINATQLRFPSVKAQAETSRRLIGKMQEMKHLHIHEASGIRLNSLTALIRSVVRRHSVRIVYIDYLNLVMGEVRKESARYLELAEISRALKQVANHLNITVVSAVQLGRDSADHIPRLKDVRESMDITFDSDIVMFLHRDRIKDGGIETLDEDTLLVIAKNRNGPLGTIKLRFHQGYLLFEEA